MSENEPKKVSLAEAMKRKLAEKQNQAKENAPTKLQNNSQNVKSQQTKKINNQRRRTGGS